MRRVKSHPSLRLYARQSKNFINDVEVDVQRRRTAGWALSIADKESIGSVTFNANLAYRHGTSAFNAIPAPEESFGEGASHPRVMTADLGALVPFSGLGKKWVYNGSLRGQRNYTLLIPQDRFAIGNRWTVRGFDGESSLSGDRGWLMRNDVGLTLVQGHEAYLGTDVGAVSGKSSEFLSGKRLVGAVTGLRGGFEKMQNKLQYDILLGVPLYKPDKFRTDSTTWGFNLNWSY